MDLIVFTKHLDGHDIGQLIEIAQGHGFEGFDLCVRPGYPVNPDNAGRALPDAARRIRAAGLKLPLVTGTTELLWPDQPDAEPLLAAMDAADVRLLKLGYYRFDPVADSYWEKVDQIRRALERWQTLGQRYNIKICYHTHNDRCMGLNGAALAHLIRGFDPAYIGAYLDPLHLLLEGEEFAFALAMIQPYLSVVACKDVMKLRVQREHHGSYRIDVVPAGAGMVDWTTVFDDLKRVNYNGPLSIHCEWGVPADQFSDTLRREVAFFQRERQRISER